MAISFQRVDVFKSVSYAINCEIYSYFCVVW